MWVKVTDPDDFEFFVNLDRFDRMVVEKVRDMVVTRLLIVLSVTEEDEFFVDVQESPEEIMKLAGVFVPSPLPG